MVGHKYLDLRCKDLLVLLSNGYCPGFFASFTSLNIGFHYDAALYHLNFQNWLLNENIIVGLVNIYEPFGLSSINEYILSNFWFEDNFIFLQSTEDRNSLFSVEGPNVMNSFVMFYV